MFRRIRDMREDHDLKQRELALYLNCAQTSYSRYERGVQEISIDMLIRLAVFYGTSIDYLLGVTDEPKPYPRA